MIVANYLKDVFENRDVYINMFKGSYPWAMVFEFRTGDFFSLLQLIFPMCVPRVGVFDRIKQTLLTVSI